MAQAERENNIFALTKADLGAPAMDAVDSHDQQRRKSVVVDQRQPSATGKQRQTAADQRQLVAAPLLPPHLVLPSHAHACQSLAFDEAKGRVCLAMRTGEVYVG